MPNFRRKTGTGQEGAASAAKPAVRRAAAPRRRSNGPVTTSLAAGQGRVLEMIATGAQLADTLTALVKLIESHAPEVLGSILLLDADGKRLRHGAAPSMPDDFSRAIDGEPVGPRAGSCGTAAYLSETVIVDDIDSDPLWADYRSLAARHGLRACWSTPILDASHNVLGTFAMYLRTPGRPTRRHLRVIEMVTHTAAIAIAKSKGEQEHQRLTRDRSAIEASLRASEAMFRSVFENAAIGMTLTDNHGTIIRCNPAFARMLGYTEEELAGKPFAEITYPEDIDANVNLYQELMTGRIASFQLNKRYLHQSGAIVWAQLSVSMAPGQETTARFTIGMVEDITARKQAEARIEYLATHDGLTGLPNRTLIHDRIAQAITHARRAGRYLALMYIDLDRFKVINDGFGHPFGDAVLKAAGDRLSDIVREGDAVARQSGDEYLVLLADLHKSADVYIVTQKIMDAFERPFSIEGREVFVTTSIGVSVYPQNGQDADTLIHNADVAMYRAKNLGRNTYQFFTAEMSEGLRQRVELETHLRQALARNELHLVYQPKVNLSTGTISGVEALLRWNHPELGIVSPARFIPLAEETGLIVPIGDWVLRTACMQNKAWLAAGLPPIVVSVNISVRQFQQPDVAGWVMQALRDTGLPPELLELELTESLLAQDTEKVVDTVTRLKEIGMQLSIDDFGTGYSSLSYIKRFRVDTLKIDQSFIRHMLTEADDAAIAVAVISLAHSLRMKAIAEGVETAEHCDFLRAHGCDEIQGYYFSKPLPAEELAAMLRTGKRLG